MFKKLFAKKDKHGKQQQQQQQTNGVVVASSSSSAAAAAVVSSNSSIGSGYASSSGKSSSGGGKKAKKNQRGHPKAAPRPLPPPPMMEHHHHKDDDDDDANSNPATAAVNAALKKQHHDDDNDKLMAQSWASSLSGASTPGSTDDEGSQGSCSGGGGGKLPAGHYRCASLPAIPGKEGVGLKPSTSAGSLKKASLRRTTSMNTGGGNPKVLQHSASAIGLDEMMEDRREFGTLGQNVVHLEVPFGKPIEEVYDGVHNGPVLGSGISGMVRLATHKATGIKYAVKVLDLGLVEADGLQQLREEIYIMCQLDHPNIVRLEEVYESHSEIYLVQELCLGGELFDRLDEQPDYHYTEAECARLVKQMLSAVRYLHSKGIIHRDLKLENFLFSSVHPNSDLKMIDFGLSKHFKYGEVQHEAVGTPYTVAPEVIRGSYDERCDIWAIGVISFLLLSGDPPFGGCGGPEPLMTVRANILQGSFAFEPEDIWATVSQSARKFINSLLVTDPSKRPTAEQAQKHQWLSYWAMRGKKESDAALNPNVVKALVNFKEFSDMRKLLCEVLSFTLLPDQIRDLRLEFEKMDTDGSGEISLAALKQVLMTNAVAGSLGALTEDEVTDIFNAMRVRKTETRIHWHEFIAAGLSQCSVDDRNLRLAFERLDSDHKGYITLDDIMDLMGSDALQSEVSMRTMWADSMKAVKCQNARITYDDFLLLMKGQTRENPSSRSGSPVPAPVHHVHTVALDSSLSSLNASAKLPIVPEGEQPPDDVPVVEASPNMPHEILKREALAKPSSMTSPTTLRPKFSGPIDSPLSMDDDDDLIQNSSGPGVPGSVASLTPPSSPVRGASDYVTPRSGRKQIEFMGGLNSGIELPGLEVTSNGSRSPSYLGRGEIARKRSVSYDEKAKDELENRESESKGESESKSEKLVGPDELHAVADIVRDMLLPETGHINVSSSDLGVDDKTSKSALVANRKLYRAHRQMRLAVLEASKRFEEQQAEHAKELLMARQAKEAGATTAGLVMRHGYHKQVSSRAIRQLLSENQAQQQQLVAVASRKGGRGRRTRKKTISDMSGMLSSIGQDDMVGVAIEAAAEPPALEATKSTPLVPTESVDTAAAKQLESEGPSRAATVPGNFRTTTDPFSPKGKYGAIITPL